MKKRKTTVTSFSCAREDEWVIDKISEYAEMEKVSFSTLIVNALKEYVKKHGDGNPQVPLFRKPTAYSANPIRGKREREGDLLETVKANPGAAMDALAARFAYSTGLRRETVVAYIRELRASGLVFARGDKLYPKELVLGRSMTSSQETRT